MKKKRAKKSAKFERCVRSVKKGMKKSSRARANPWAVCHAALKKGKKRTRRDPSSKAEIISVSRRPEGTNYLVKVHDPKFKGGYDLVDVLMHDNGATSTKSANRSTSTAFYAIRAVKAHIKEGHGGRMRRDPSKRYRKIWFSKGSEHTAGLIVTDAWIAAHKTNLVSDASRLFPMHEARKMGKFHVSPAFATWEQAFAFKTSRDPHRMLVNRPPRRDPHRMHVNRPPRHFARNYEGREIDSFLADLARVEKAPLADRKEGARHFAQAMGHDPELVAERVGWLLDGNYGQGSYIKAREVARSPRMNRVAWLTQTVGALEWQSPWAMTRAAWKKLTKAQKDALDHAVMRALKSHLQEGG